jgi:hypothetical protein
LPPPAESSFCQLAPGGAQASPNFLRPAFISQTGTRNFPLLRAHPPVSPPIVLALAHTKRRSSQ